MNTMAHPCLKVVFTKYSSSPIVSRSFYCLWKGTSRQNHKSLYLEVHRPTMVLPLFCQYLTRNNDHQHRLLSSSSQPDKSDKLRVNERGGIWIYIGWTILGLVGIDQALQYKQAQEDEERRELLTIMQLDADNASVNVANFDETLPTLFTCKILYIDPGLDGTKMLTRIQRSRRERRDNSTRMNGGVNKNIQENDIVEIVEAGVGPNQDYHVCRLRQRPQKKSDRNNDADTTGTAIIGWYPIKFLERVDE